MNKLGLKIVRINQGYTDLLEINGDAVWTKEVRDIRTDLGNVDNLDGSSAVLMLTSVDTGHILTIAKFIGGRGSDCISAWIYVPASIKIKGEKLEKIVKKVEKEILADQHNDEKLTQLFSESYESVPANINTAKSNGEKCAYRYYGSGTRFGLHELLENMCQSYYKDYKSVFLLEKTSNLKCSTGVDLTTKEVPKAFEIKPPENTKSFAPYYNNQPFTNEIRANKGDKIKVEWKQDGFKPILKEFIVDEGVKCPTPTPNEMIMIVPSKRISVRDKDSGGKIEGYKLIINEVDWSNKEPWEISCEKIDKSEVNISALGYEDYKGTCDLRKENKIEMTKKTNNYKFVIQSKNCGNLSISYQTQDSLEDCPIEGYEPCSGNIVLGENKLEYRPFTKTIKIVLSIIIPVALLAGWCLGDYLNIDYLNKKEISGDKPSTERPVENNGEEKKDTPQASESPKSESSNLEEGIKYLNRHNEWERNEMEKYAELKGLWDALNTYNFEEILRKEELKESKKFDKLFKAIDKAKDKPKPKEKYCSEGDTKITIKTYIDKLNNSKSDGKAPTNKNKTTNQNDV